MTLQAVDIGASRTHPEFHFALMTSLKKVIILNFGANIIPGVCFSCMSCIGLIDFKGIVSLKLTNISSFCSTRY